jgi:transcriptional regulator with XRE-family HTH domain
VADMVAPDVVQALGYGSMTHDGGIEDRAYPLLFGRHLKVLRVKAGLSQEQLAERAGMHRTTIGRLERGQSGLSLDRLPDLAAALEVEPRDLIPPGSDSQAPGQELLP